MLDATLRNMAPGSVDEQRLMAAKALLLDLRGSVSGERKTWPSKEYLVELIRGTI